MKSNALRIPIEVEESLEEVAVEKRHYLTLVDTSLQNSEENQIAVVEAQDSAEIPLHPIAKMLDKITVLLVVAILITLCMPIGLALYQQSLPNAPQHLLDSPLIKSTFSPHK